MEKQRIAIIEDEIELLQLLGSMCTDLNFESHEFRTYEDFIFKFSSIEPHLIITDRNLPGTNGNELIRSIRKIDSKIPIIMISGSNSSENIVDALKLGADDFISKPFHPDILTLKINKILAQNLNLANQDLIVKKENRIIKVGDQEVFLTNLEFKIFEQLYNNIDEFVNRENLLEQDHSRSLDVHINKIRKKIAPLNYVIETIRSAGYRLKKNSLDN